MATNLFCWHVFYLCHCGTNVGPPYRPPHHHHQHHPCQGWECCLPIISSKTKTLQNSPSSPPPTPRSCLVLVKLILTGLHSRFRCRHRRRFSTTMRHINSFANFHFACISDFCCYSLSVLFVFFGSMLTKIEINHDHCHHSPVWAIGNAPKNSNIHTTTRRPSNVKWESETCSKSEIIKRRRIKEELMIFCVHSFFPGASWATTSTLGENRKMKGFTHIWVGTWGKTWKNFWRTFIDFL